MWPWLAWAAGAVPVAGWWLILAADYATRACGVAWVLRAVWRRTA